MSTTNYPNPRPLFDTETNKPFFPVTLASYVINGVTATNPKFFGSIFLNSFEIFSTVTEGDVTKVNPLAAQYGGTGFNNLDDLANRLATILGFKTEDSAATIVPITKGGTGKTTASEALSALGGATVNLFSVTVPVSWTSNDDGSFTQDVALAGIKSTDVPVVGVILSSDTDAAKLQGKAFACVNRITTSTNNLTMYCYTTKPETAFTIQLLTVRGF